MNEDAALLRRYVEEGSQSAFAELVRRHVDLVYAAALRRTENDSHRAADVAQHVFTSLARQAGKLIDHPALSAWLHAASRNAALNLMFSERRRRAREEAAQALAPKFETADAALHWDQLRPALDAAIDELPEADRTAVVLRFLEHSSFARIGAALRVTDDAARMRTDRALEKLRVALARRGITSSATALSALVASQPLVSAPLGLAATLTAQSLATARASLGLLATFTTLMNAKLVTTAAVTALIFFGVGTYVGYDATASLPLPPLAVSPDQPRQIAALRQENQRLQAELVQLNTQLATRNSSRPSAPPPPAPIVQSASPNITAASQQRAMLNNLRQLSAATDQFKLEMGRYPSSLDELVGETKYIKRLNAVDGEIYANVPLTGQPMTVVSAAGVSVTYDSQGLATTQIARPSQAEQMAKIAADLGPKVGPSFERAVAAYQASHEGNFPPNPQALIPYFATPSEGADFVETIDAKNRPR